MSKVLLSLGSNLGDKAKLMQSMEDGLDSILSSPIKRSRLMETEAVGVDYPQPSYLNRIVSGFFFGTADELLSSCDKIEKTLGRIRAGFRSPRSADIDILFFGDQIIRSSDLVIPHPAVCERRFCIEGLLEIEPDFIDPVSGNPVRVLYNQLDDTIMHQSVFFLSELL